MNEVTGPVISITLVLMAVFLPTAFLRRHHRADVPAVRADDRGHGAHQRHQRADAQAGPVRACGCSRCRRRAGSRGRSTRSTGRSSAATRGASATCLRVWWLVLLVFVGVAVGTGWWYQQTPTGFLPEEDQGYIIIAVQLPDAASLDRTREVTEQDEHDPPRHARASRTGSSSAASRCSTAPPPRTPRPRSPPGRTGRSAKTPELAAGGAGRAAPDGVRRDPRGDHPRARPAVDPGAGVRRRVPDAGRGPRGRRAGRAPGARAGDRSTRRRKRPEVDPARIAQHVPRRRAADLPRTSTARRPRRWA